MEIFNHVIDVSNLTAGEFIKINCRIEVDIPAAYGCEDATIVISVNGLLEKLNRKYRLTGRASLEANMECALCLETVVVPISFELDDEFSEPGCFQDPEVWPVLSNKIDLTGVCREHCLLNLPLKVLCKKDSIDQGGADNAYLS